VQLGEMRIGPDLANVGARKVPYDAEDLLKFLYTGSAQHPSYKFLFEQRAIIGQPSANAMKLGSKYPVAPGYEIVPTERAQTLVAYLLSLNSSYAYPEETAVNTAPPAAKAGEKSPAPKGDTGNALAPSKEGHHP
jgi:cytochrome c oxidase cbb3-type subunit 2